MISYLFEELRAVYDSDTNLIVKECVGVIVEAICILNA